MAMGDPNRWDRKLPALEALKYGVRLPRATCDAHGCDSDSIGWDGGHWCEVHERERTRREARATPEPGKGEDNG